MKRIITIMSVFVAAITMARAQEPIFYITEQNETLTTTIPGAQIAREAEPGEVWSISLAGTGFFFSPAAPPGFSVGEPPGEAGSNVVEILTPQTAIWASDLGPLPSIVPNIEVLPNIILLPTGAPAILVAEDLPATAPDASSTATLMILGLGGLALVRATCRFPTRVRQKIIASR